MENTQVWDEMCKKKEKREGAGCDVRWSRQMVEGCVPNQLHDGGAEGGESSKNQSREKLRIKTNTSLTRDQSDSESDLMAAVFFSPRRIYCRGEKFTS